MDIVFLKHSSFTRLCSRAIRSYIILTLVIDKGKKGEEGTSPAHDPVSLRENRQIRPSPSSFPDVLLSGYFQTYLHFPFVSSLGLNVWNQDL